MTNQSGLSTRFETRIRTLLGVGCCLAAFGASASAQIMPLSVPQSQQARLASTGAGVAVFIDGSVKGSKDGGQGTTTSGALGIAIKQSKWDGFVSVNVAAVDDTVRSSYGRSLLVPGSGGFSAGAVELRRNLGGFNLPTLYTRAYLSASSFSWKLPPAPGAAVTDSVGTGANALGAGVGLSWQLIDGFIVKKTDDNKDEESKVGARVDFMVIRRALHGDVMHPNFDSARIATVGEQSVFYGFEIGAILSFKDIRGSINYYSFPKAPSISGFTRGQVTAGFAIAAPILQGNLQR